MIKREYITVSNEQEYDKMMRRISYEIESHQKRSVDLLVIYHRFSENINDREANYIRTFLKSLKSRKIIIDWFTSDNVKLVTVYGLEKEPENANQITYVVLKNINKDEM